MATLDLQAKLMVGEGWDDFALVDSGDGRKLERYGPHRFIRPEPQALWAPRQAVWQADGEFVPGSDEDGGGRWTYTNPVPREGWPLAWKGIGFTAQCTPFRHLGFFPDMAPVTHIDASKKAVAQARANAAVAGLEDRPVRWIVDDAAKFAAREVRRERRYDGIILDPPKFGRGPEGEVWRLEESLPPLIADCARLLGPQSRFLFLTVYAVRMSSLAIAGLLAEALAGLPGTIEHGDLAIREEGENGRILPTAIFARWSNPGS